MDEGLKFDDEKIRLDLIPPELMLEVGKVLTYGAKKYGDRNWEKGIAFSRVYGATLRHLIAWWEGEDLDESGHKHLSHAACNLAFLLWYTEHRNEFDDRPNTQHLHGSQRECLKSLEDCSRNSEPHNTDNEGSSHFEEREVIGVTKDYTEV